MKHPILKKICITTLIASQLTYTNDRVKLHSLALEKGDGKPYAINADRVYFVRWVISRLAHLIQGYEVQKDKTKLSLFIIDGNAYSLEELNQLDLEIKEKLSTYQHAVKINNNTQTNHELKTYKEKYDHIQKDIDHCLKITQEHFIKYIEPFDAMIRPVKKSITELVSDFCVKRNCPNSLMLEWGKNLTRNEKKIVEKVMTTPTRTQEFLNDVITFLKDFLYSCPKAYEQYRKKYLSDTRKQ